MDVIHLGAADGLPPMDWVAPAHNARTKWLATINEEGSPHLTAVGAIWLDGAFWFQTGAGIRKGATSPRTAPPSTSRSRS